MLTIQRRRLFELAMSELVALVPLVVVVWYALMDEDDREGAVARVRGLRDRLTAAKLRQWLASPEVAYARARRADMIRGELDAAVRDQGWTIPAEEVAV